MLRAVPLRRTVDSAEQSGALGTAARERWIALVPTGILGAILIAWSWERGGYFSVAFLPGALAILLLAAMLLLVAPWRARLDGPARIALLSLLALAVWTAASLGWSEVRDVAIEDVARSLIYAGSYGIALWGCQLLGRDMAFAGVVVVGAIGVVAVATAVSLAVRDSLDVLLHEDATLRYPLGYRNAVGAFFAMGALGAAALAPHRGLDWRLRGALAAVGSLCLALTLLAQSRGTIFAAVVGVAVLLIASRERRPTFAWAALMAAPVVAIGPLLADVYQSGGGDLTEVADPLREAALAALVVAALAGAIGCVLARRWVPLPPVPWPQRRRRLAAIALAVAVPVVAVGATIPSGGPLAFADDRIEELGAGSPDLSAEGSRFGVNLGTDRADYWSVAWQAARDDPLTGTGAGGFRFSFLREREDANADTPEDPHSIEMLMLSELGLPGLVLFAAFVVTAILAALRSRRLGPSAASLSAAALAVGAYWLVHASVDWFWSYPAVTAPALLLLGAAAAPALLQPRLRVRGAGRVVLAVGATVLAVAVVPFYLSDRYLRAGVANPRPAAALDDLDRAADLNPFAYTPLIREAEVAARSGDTRRALEALREASDRRPPDWLPHYLAGRLLAPSDPEGALRELDLARALNPLNADVRDERERVLEVFPALRGATD